MKRFFIFLVATIGLVACESDLEGNEPFADEIATFDIATLDPVELTAALTSSFVEEVGGSIHDYLSGWQPLRSMLGRSVVHYIFYADGRCWSCVPFLNAEWTAPPMHNERTWTYDDKNGVIFISGVDDQKVLYYKGDRLILECQGVASGGAIVTKRVEYRLRFGEQIRQEMEEVYKTSSKEWYEEQQANN